MNIFQDNPALWLILIFFLVGCTVIYFGSRFRERSLYGNEKKQCGKEQREEAREEGDVLKVVSEGETVLLKQREKDERTHTHAARRDEDQDTTSDKKVQAP
jgi:hypothetical protein